MATLISGTQIVHIAATDPTNIIGFYEGASAYTFADSQGGNSGFFIVNEVPQAQWPI